MKEKIDFQLLGTILKFGFLMETRVRKGQKKRNALVPLIIMYLFAGFTVGFYTLNAPDLFSLAMLSSMVSMLLMGNFMLIEYPHIVTGPEDFSFYAIRPVNSPTYFASKMVLAALMTLILTGVFSIPALSMMIWLPSFSLGTALSFLLLNFFSGLFIAFFIINFYSFLLKFFSYQIIKNVSGIFQFIVFIAIYGAYFYMSNRLRSQPGESFLSFTFNFSSYFIPPAWFASFFINPLTLQNLFTMLFAPLSIILFTYMAYKSISMGYAEKISEQMLKSAVIKNQKSKELPILGSEPEARAIFTLLKNHFKYSTQFRMSILAIVPITVIYFIMVLFNSPNSILDPFTSLGQKLFSDTILLYIGVGIFPLYIKNALAYSHEAEASWVLYTSPYQATAMIKAVRRFILMFFIVPYLLIFATVFGFYTQAWWSTLKHFTVVTLLCLIQTDILIYMLAEIPFSKIPQKGQRSIGLYLRIVLSLLTAGVLYVVVTFVYPFENMYWIMVILLFLIAALINHLGKKRAGRILSQAEFPGT